MKAEEGMMGRVYVLVAAHKVCEAHSEHALHDLLLEGLGACPPFPRRKILKNGCYEIESDGTFEVITVF